MSRKDFKLKLYNTLGREVQDFVSIEPNKARLYACGPTVYANLTIGNFRTYIFEDILRRTLEYLDYNVRHVMNITDVGHLTSDADDGEDKMVSGAKREGKSVWEIAEYYTKQYFTDADSLNILRPHVIAKATDHIQDMINMIQQLEGRGFTYEADGNVFFDVGKFERYDELALLDRQNLQAGFRVSIDSSKRNPADFGLWFTHSKFEHQEMLWDSPWGKGYPGWHIECSAMASRYLGNAIDIHCGGIDHIPVHHTNEIAQSEAALGIYSKSNQRWVNYWCHGEFLKVDGTKMGKSLGNLITLDDLIKQGFSPLDYRFFVLGAHYRSHQNFTIEALKGAQSSRKNMCNQIAELIKNMEIDHIDELKSLRLSVDQGIVLDNMIYHASNDLSIPRVLSELWALLRRDDVSVSIVLKIIEDIDQILGLGLCEEGLIIAQRSSLIDTEIDLLIKERDKARLNKDYIKADAIRDQLLEKGIELRDSPSGTLWHKLS